MPDVFNQFSFFIKCVLSGVQNYDEFFDKINIITINTRAVILFVIFALFCNSMNELFILGCG
ncbi:MAG: hypothetical protein EA394_06010 [Bacteroidia bacterium]|nr:MAG: hypothetical protein EA394_06010 [Bacteroidia bacterium]